MEFSHYFDEWHAVDLTATATTSVDILVHFPPVRAGID